MTARWQYDSEREWQRIVVEYANKYGWSVFHHQDSRRTTPGWPDLAMFRVPDFMLVELKTDTGKVSRHQRSVLEALEQCGVEVHVWRPLDEPEVMHRLGRDHRWKP